MDDYPKVIVFEETNHDYSEELDEIFTKLLEYEEGYSEKMVEIRKQQILKHSNCSFIMDALNDLANLICKEQNSSTEFIMEMAQERLIILHSPVQFDNRMNLEPFHKWEEWTFEELAAYYFDLMLMKGFEDRYVFDVIGNRVWYCGEWTEGIKNYHVIYMLNDLVIYDSKICGYEFRSFMNDYDKNRFLKQFKYNPLKDQVIHVKTEEKYSSEELKNIVKDYSKEGIKLKEVSYAPGCIRQEFFKKRDD